MAVLPSGRILLCVCIAALGFVSGAGNGSAAAQFASGVDLVEVYATVTDQNGAPVAHLEADDFVVEEDGVPQRVSAFASEGVPLALAFGVDRSFSVSARTLDRVVLALREMVDRLQAGDRVMLVGIGSETEILAPLSDDRRLLRSALATLEPWGTTPLWDATLAATDAIQSAAGRRALILLSDGRDRYSHLTPGELLALVRQRDVLVYPVAVGASRPPVFAELAAVTGGRSFQADVRELPAVLATIATELRTHYLVGYVPTVAGADRPGWRSVRLSVKRAGLRVRAREGYVAGMPVHRSP